MEIAADEQKTHMQRETNTQLAFCVFSLLDGLLVKPMAK